MSGLLTKDPTPCSSRERLPRCPIGIAGGAEAADSSILILLKKRPATPERAGSPVGLASFGFRLAPMKLGLARFGLEGFDAGEQDLRTHSGRAQAFCPGGWVSHHH